MDEFILLLGCCVTAVIAVSDDTAPLTGECLGSDSGLHPNYLYNFGKVNECLQALVFSSIK